ncbi:putative nuclear envelope protein [Zalerion maritima]|uniref:Nuclear envelope protein n=1 Tax=Zalerion maritima TaxID=339359 RepID=A0AAD5RUT7_9PEZI|nr:putative nuclear envelope protein [Zalerion maritima]
MAHLNPRTNEGNMEWEYHGQGPMDPQSPFSAFASQNINAFGRNPNAAAHTFSFSSSPEKPLPSLPRMGSQKSNNPFASTPRAESPIKESSMFDRSFQNSHRAPPFLNPAFTTHRKPVDEATFSEMSGAESSPAATDADISEIPIDSPDMDRPSHRLDCDAMSISPSRRAKAAYMYGKSAAIPPRTSGKGEIPRGKYGHLDKIRKRKRHNEDRDVGTVRYRIESDTSEDESGSADDTDAVSRIVRGGKRTGMHVGSGRKRSPKQGWLGGFLSTITTNPTAPDVLVQWQRFLLQSIITAIVIYFLWSVVCSIRHDMNLAADKARSERLGTIAECATNYHENRCFPREKRLPRLMKDCDEWEVCMNQDEDDIATVTVGVKQFVALLNEMVSDLQLKTIGFLAGLAFLAAFGMRIGSGNPPYAPSGGQDKVTAGGGGGGRGEALPFGDHNQGYVWAAIPTPHRLKGSRVLEEGTDTDASPEPYKSIMPPPPETPSRRRSPSKDKRRISPVKGLRSPTKGY